MSAIGGILMFDGAPVDREALASLGARLDRLGPDGGREVIAGSVGMTYRAFHTNAESRRERQPYCSGHQAVLCFDGRLDNRDELVKQLSDDLRGDDTDAAIVMAAFLKWRVDGIAKLVGDFALAMWDRREHAVWLARDCVGTRRLYYHAGTDRLIWSTDPGAVLDLSRISTRVDDEYVADYLTIGPEAGRTPYVGLQAVKPAYAVRVDERRSVSEQRFWAIDLQKEIRYQSEDEYAEHFRELFRDAVRTRLRSDRPVFAELSGGLDSSSIVCMSDDILRKSDASAPALETVSYVFRNSPDSDESEWIDHVEKHRGVRGHRFDEVECPFLRPIEDATGIVLPSVLLMSAAFPLAVRARMRSRGARVLLSGEGGDHMLLSVPNPMPELISAITHGRLIALHRALREWSPVVQRPYVTLLWQQAVVPLLPLCLAGRLLQRTRSDIPDWLHPDFVRRHRLRERWMRGVDRAEASARGMRCGATFFGLAVRQRDIDARAELGGWDITYPYLHRPLVEYVLAVPIEHRLGAHETRMLMRRGLAHILPEATLQRQCKGSPSGLIARSMARERARLYEWFERSRVVERGYVSEAGFRSALQRRIEGGEKFSGTLTRVIALELWLQSIEKRQRTAFPDAADGREPAAGPAAVPLDAAV